MFRCLVRRCIILKELPNHPKISNLEGIIKKLSADEYVRITDAIVAAMEQVQAAFDAAQLGNTCSDVDNASRVVLESHGLGPDYKLPGLPHRTGHGIGLGIHEWPYIVRNDKTVLGNIVQLAHFSNYLWRLNVPGCLHS